MGCGGRKAMQILVKCYSEGEALKFTVVSLGFGLQHLGES